MIRLTRPQRAALDIAIGLGGTIRVYPDQRAVITQLEAQGLMEPAGGGWIDRRSTITPAGRAALKEQTP